MSGIYEILKVDAYHHSNFLVSINCDVTDYFSLNTLCVVLKILASLTHCANQTVCEHQKCWGKSNTAATSGFQLSQYKCNICPGRCNLLKCIMFFFQYV